MKEYVVHLPQVCFEAFSSFQRCLCFLYHFSVSIPEGKQKNPFVGTTSSLFTYSSITFWGVVIYIHGRNAIQNYKQKVNLCCLLDLLMQFTFTVALYFLMWILLSFQPEDCPLVILQGRSASSEFYFYLSEHVLIYSSLSRWEGKPQLVVASS